MLDSFPPLELLLPLMAAAYGCARPLDGVDSDPARRRKLWIAGAMSHAYYFSSHELQLPSMAAAYGCARPLDGVDSDPARRTGKLWIGGAMSHA
jgi:hypothetical protein